MVINMVDLRKLVGVLDAVYNCDNRNCLDCRKLYGIKPTENRCPIWENKENVLEALKVLEKWLDDEYDINCQLGTKPTYEVSEKEFMNILNGVYMERKEQ